MGSWSVKPLGLGDVTDPTLDLRIDNHEHNKLNK